ncbi:MAG: helix-turn-helix transcriptional regulator [Oscillospiraceae bacterium]|nr:helix-turn-helix transcriptional regulator [Oscillospiraceae bacterium]
MNKDFPRIMTLLRKERGLSQKQAAADLEVTQALLSHYENGKRECGLDFLVRAADYYNVSVDYLLGRSPMSSGASVTEQQLPESSDTEKYDGSPSGLSVFFQKKLLTNSIEILFSLLIKAKNSELSKAVYSYLSLAVYRCYRMIYSAGKKNDEHVFSIPEEKVSGLTSAALAVEDIRAREAGNIGGSDDEKITTARIEQEYTNKAAALLSVVNSSEKTLNKFQ